LNPISAITNWWGCPAIPSLQTTYDDAWQTGFGSITRDDLEMEYLTAEPWHQIMTETTSRPDTRFTSVLRWGADLAECTTWDFEWWGLHWFWLSTNWYGLTRAAFTTADERNTYEYAVQLDQFGNGKADTSWKIWSTTSVHILSIDK